MNNSDSDSKYGRDWTYPKATQSQVVGICSGALAAAAVCSSTTFSNLIPNAVKSAVIAFRIGLASAEAGSTVSVSENFDKSWSTVVPRMTLEQAREIVESEKVSSMLDIRIQLTIKDVPFHSRPYIGSVSESGVAINGPPAVLDQLRATLSQTVTSLYTIPNPINAKLEQLSTSRYSNV